MAVAEAAEVRTNKAKPASAGETRPGRFGFFVLIALLWVFFYGIWSAFPGIRSGSDLIYAAKEQMARDGLLFPPSVPVSRRLAIFGNSKVLSGFIPAQFDTEVPVYSVNMGKPDDSHFAGDIERLARTGQLPRIVLLTLPWATAEPARVPADDEVMTALFPFRKLPRDAILFWLRARRRGGMAAFYRFGERSVSRMRQDRGWYFIEGQSHYPGDSLPADFRLPTDRPDVTDDPAFLPQGPEFHRIDELARRFGFRVLIVPSYHREGELAPSPAYAATVARRLRGYTRFEVLGPDYYLFPNRCFSDPVHLNPAGAKLYTARLAAVLAGHAF